MKRRAPAARGREDFRSEERKSNATDAERVDIQLKMDRAERERERGGDGKELI